MNIYSNPSIINRALNVVQENIIPKLNPTQTKVALVALWIFALIAVGLTYFFCFSDRYIADKTKEKGENPAKVDDAANQALKKKKTEAVNTKKIEKAEDKTIAIKVDEQKHPMIDKLEKIQNTELRLDPAPQEIKLYVKTLTGPTIEVQIDENGTVEDLKKKIESQGNTPANQNRLLFHGKQLEDHITLKIYQITNNSVLHSVGRLGGD